jgi:hypothetical protein
LRRTLYCDPAARALAIQKVLAEGGLTDDEGKFVDLPTQQSVSVNNNAASKDLASCKPELSVSDGLFDKQDGMEDHMEALSARTSSCAPTCYEIEPGRWIHHRGCKTPVPQTALRQAEHES